MARTEYFGTVVSLHGKAVGVTPDGQLVLGGRIVTGVGDETLVIGNVFYVDPTNGSDTRSGLSAGAPLATLNAAIGKCTADNGDVIVVSPGDHDVTETVAFDVSGVTVVAAQLGLPAEVQGEKFTVNAGSGFTDGPAATITAPCRIIGLGFAGRQLTGESLLIDCQEAGGFSGGFISLENCRFSCWYGAIDCGIRTIGGALNHIVGCSFDGLFAGFDVAGIIMENDTGGLAPAYTRVLGNRFSGVGSGKHAINHAVGSVPVGQLYAHNTMDAGFLGNLGKFLENNSVVSGGMIADNWLGGLADQSAAFENLGASTLKFSGNHYEEA